MRLKIEVFKDFSIPFLLNWNFLFQIKIKLINNILTNKLENGQIDARPDCTEVQDR